MSSQRVSFVTGSARGIGAATAMVLSARGDMVVVSDLREGDCDETVTAIRASGGDAFAMACDVTNEQAVEAAFDRVVAEHARVDVLVNNAGILRDNLIFKMPLADWRQVLDTHLTGTFLCARAAQRIMVGQGGGQIVNVSSISALGNRGQVNYSAAKAGIVGFTRALAKELGKFNIRVNAVAPGIIETAMTAEVARRTGAPYEDYKRECEAMIPLGRMGQPEEVGEVVAFLSSPQASFISGQVVFVTGGSH